MTWYDLIYLKIFGIPMGTILITIAVIIFVAWLFGGRKPKNGGEDR